MNLLIISATKLEINDFLKKNNCIGSKDDYFFSQKYRHINIDILISGIGLVATSYQITKAIMGKKYDLLINIGIAGSFNRNITIGEVVQVIQEEFGDLGIENQSSFQTLFEAGFQDKNDFPFQEGKLIQQISENHVLKNLKKVKAISSNTAHGNNDTIRALQKKFDADIETMEGAAFFYVTMMEKLNFIQIRAISNYVEERNKESWDIPLAIKNLSNLLLQFIESI